MTQHFETEDEATRWAIDWLRGRRFVVMLPDESVPMVPPVDLCRKHGLPYARTIDRLNHAACPHFEAERSAGGRLLRVRPNEALLTYLKAEPQPGKRLKPVTTEAT